MKSNILFLGSVLLLAACSSNKTPPDMGGPAKYATEKSYCIKNVKYQPLRKYDYCAVGTASWYGTFENGCPTATGVIFNRDFMTAAHRTLPLPCVVEVTNLETKKKAKVFVNDRGPFADTSNRIIDLSLKAAKELNAYNRGIAKVKVKCLPYESMLASLYYGRMHYHPRYQSKITLTPNERKYIKEKIIRDYSSNCESLSKKRKYPIKQARPCPTKSCTIKPKKRLKRSKPAYSALAKQKKNSRHKQNLRAVLGNLKEKGK